MIVSVWHKPSNRCQSFNYLSYTPWLKMYLHYNSIHMNSKQQNTKTTKNTKNRKKSTAQNKQNRVTNFQLKKIVTLRHSHRYVVSSDQSLRLKWIWMWIWIWIKWKRKYYKKTEKQKKKRKIKKFFFLKDRKIVSY